MKLIIYSVSAAVLAVVLTACCCIRKKTEESSVSKPQVILDVRSSEEFAVGHLAGAILIPHTQIEMQIMQKVPDKNTVIALYCRSGRRADIAKEAMKKLGYKNVANYGSMEKASEQLKVKIVK